MGKDVYGERFNTPIGRVSYPHVFKKGQGKDGKEGKFEITLLLPKKTTDIADLEKRIDEIGTKAFSGAWVNIKKKKPVVRDGDEWADEKKAEGKDAEVYRGNWYIKARTSKRPGVVGPDKTPIAEEDDLFYGGCYARANVTPGSYDNESKGVTLYLNAVQKVRDGERFGGGSVDPDSVFDAFEDAASSMEDDGF
jgi:hypothetical protein